MSDEKPSPGPWRWNDDRTVLESPRADGRPGRGPIVLAQAAIHVNDGRVLRGTLEPRRPPSLFDPASFEDPWQGLIHTPFRVTDRQKEEMLAMLTEIKKGAPQHFPDLWINERLGGYVVDPGGIVCPDWTGVLAAVRKLWGLA